MVSPIQSRGVTPADDAHIQSVNPTNNYGSAATLEVDDSPIEHFLLKFDVTGVNGGQVTNAKLCLYRVDSANQGGDPSTWSRQARPPALFIEYQHPNPFEK